jgi:hypothetical protein
LCAIAAPGIGNPDQGAQSKKADLEIDFFCMAMGGGVPRSEYAKGCQCFFANHGQVSEIRCGEPRQSSRMLALPF